MDDVSTVRHATIVVPAGLNRALVVALAEQKAQAEVGEQQKVAFVHLHGLQPSSGEGDAEVTWRYSYQVIKSEDAS